MKKLIIILALLTLFSSCDNPKETKTSSTEKSTLDSLTIEKNDKKMEAEKLNLELDSLRKLRDSLSQISN